MSRCVRLFEALSAHTLVRAVSLVATLAVLGMAGAPGRALAAKCPNVHIVLDRSGSMVSTMMGGGTRWSAATSTINKLVGIADPLRAAKIGLSIFPSTGCGTELSVRPDYSTKALIAAAMAALMPSGSTPSGSAIRDAAALTELKDGTRKQYIVLLTDGSPGCGGEPDTVTGTVNQIAMARSASPSIATFVLGVGDGLSTSEQAALGQMADAGGYPEATLLRYYKGTTTAELESSLTKIMFIIQGENSGCVDPPPADMAAPMDLATPPMDLAAPPKDLAMSPMDLAMSPTDLAMSPMDLAMSPMDLAMSPMDLAVPAMDLAMPPVGDLASATQDLATSGTADGGAGLRPLVEWISPREIEQGKSGPAVIRGSGFVTAAPGASVYFEGGSRLASLSNVLVEDDKTIKVFVPADLPAGVYDVVVKNPDGAIGRLSGGFTVVAQTASGCSCEVGGRARPLPSPLALLFGLGLLALLGRRAAWRGSRRTAG